MPTSRSRDAAAALIKGDTRIFVLCKLETPPVYVKKATMVVQPEPTPAIIKMRLSFVIGVVQALPMWILAELVYP